FRDEGMVPEEPPPAPFSREPAHERAWRSLSQILHP
ncbi:MAG: amino acid ABC transporter ATP-binding protein, partial [Bacillota bacterium]